MFRKNMLIMILQELRVGAKLHLIWKDKMFVLYAAKMRLIELLIPILL